VPYTPFRPRKARVTAWTFAAAQFVVLTAGALLAPGSGPVAFAWYDRVGVIAVAGAIAWFLSRFARLEAVPDEDGLRVRNLLVTTRLAWAQVVAVRFRDGDPWVSLDLSDGDTLAVMAVQRADGEHGRAEARRLAALVAQHTPTG
jgi:hypothetical protein